jgi:hypothetical protein
MPKITYYALIDEAHPPERPYGVVRRIHTEPYPTDEAFTRNMEWEFTIQLRGGRSCPPKHVEIGQELAEAVISRWRSEYSKGITPDSPGWLKSED